MRRGAEYLTEVHRRAFEWIDRLGAAFIAEFGDQQFWTEARNPEQQRTARENLAFALADREGDTLLFDTARVAQLRQVVGDDVVDRALEYVQRAYLSDLLANTGTPPTTS